MVPEVVARGSSNAACLKASSASQSLQIWPVLFHEAVDENKGGSHLYLLLRAMTTADGEVFAHGEGQNEYINQHAPSQWCVCDL